MCLPSCKDNHVRLERRPIREREPCFSEARDRAPVLDLDVSIDNVFTRANVCSKGMSGTWCPPWPSSNAPK